MLNDNLNILYKLHDSGDFDIVSIKHIKKKTEFVCVGHLNNNFYAIGTGKDKEDALHDLSRKICEYQAKIVQYIVANK